MQFQILCRSFPIFSSLIRRKGHNRKFDDWPSRHMSAISQSGLLHSALGREKSQCRSIVNNFQCRQCSSHLLLTIQISRVVEKLKGRERAASGWAGLSCDARQQLGERMRTSALSACAPSSQGREIQRTHCACSAARIWLTHTRVPLCTPYMNATFIECLNFH